MKTTLFVAAAASLLSSSGLAAGFNTSQLAFFPASGTNSNGIGVLVLPGGGYSGTAIVKEGYTPATYLNGLGIDAWALEYTTTSNKTAPIWPTPMDETLYAIRHIRSTNKQIKKLGVWGFSAGGHLAAMAVTNATADLAFAILAYAVIDMEGSNGLQAVLIGGSASAAQKRSITPHHRVSSSTPPTFLMHTGNDNLVPVRHSLIFVEQMIAFKRRVHTLIIPDGTHGIGLALNDPMRNWTPELKRFLTYWI